MEAQRPILTLAILMGGLRLTFQPVIGLMAEKMWEKGSGEQKNLPESTLFIFAFMFLAFSSVLVFYSPINIFKSHCEGLGIGDRKRELREEGQGSRLEVKI